MWPESIEVFDEFPRTPSLKVVKREVVQQIARLARSGLAVSAVGRSAFRRPLA